MQIAGNISDYTDRVARILPIEFVAVYLTVSQLVLTENLWRQKVLLVTLAICLLLIPVYLIRVKKIKTPGHVALVVLSFLVWTYSLGHAFKTGPWIPYELYNPVIGTAAMVVWGLVPMALNIEERSQ
jgi:hypothetical protein